MISSHFKNSIAVIPSNFLLVNGRPYDDRILTASRIVVYPSTLSEFLDRRWRRYSPFHTVMLILSKVFHSTFIVKWITSKYEALVVVASYNKLQSYILKNCSCARRVELQHGHIRSDHLFYASITDSIDTFLVWSEAYALIMHKLNPHIKCVDIGDPFQINRCSFNTAQILLIDQWSIRQTLEKIENRLKSQGCNELLIKLHPNKTYWSDHNYSSAVIRDSRRLIELNTLPKVVVGAYSTALFEAALMGCEVYCVDEYYEPNMIDFGIKMFSQFEL